MCMPCLTIFKISESCLRVCASVMLASAVSLLVNVFKMHIIGVGIAYISKK